MKICLAGVGQSVPGFEDAGWSVCLKGLLKAGGCLSQLQWITGLNLRGVPWMSGPTVEGSN